MKEIGSHQAQNKTKTVEKLFKAKKEYSEYKQCDVYKDKNMKALTDWFCAAKGTRYFLLHTKGHTMAAVGSKFGTLRFFDLNSGVVSTRYRKHLANFMHNYFNDEDIKPHYKASSGFMELSGSRLARSIRPAQVPNTGKPFLASFVISPASR